MQLQIITETDNPLFNRKEIEATVKADVTPSREDVRKLVSEKFSTAPENVKIRTIKGKFGSKVFVIVANIYKSKEDLEKVELMKKKDVQTEKKVEEPVSQSEPSQPKDSTLSTQNQSSEPASEQNSNQ